MSAPTTDELLAQLATAATAATATVHWHTLPPQVYCSPEIYDLEIERVFQPGWILIAHVSQLPEAGDFRVVDTAGELLVVTRDRDGALHVLSRTCPHRWMDICARGPAHGSLPSLQCPYHKWTFSHDGSLRAAPEMGETPGFDLSEHCLHEFRHEVWEGFVFVNLDGQAPPTAELWGPMSGQLTEYGLADWVVADSIEWGESMWDWKVFIDNGECYHHIGAHLDTLQPFFPARRVLDLPDNGEYTLLFAPGADEILETSPDGQRDFPSEDPPVSGLTDLQRTALGLAYPFPNYVISLMPAFVFWFEAHPLGPGRLEFTSHLLLPPHLIGADGHDERLAAHAEVFREIHEQDIVMCEGVQRGLATSAARPGMLSTLEQHNRTFARWYARQMTRA